MKYVLDTMTVSALMIGDARIMARLRALDRADVSVPQPVFAEIAYGVARLPKSKKKDALRAQFEAIRAELRRAEWSNDVSDAFGEIKASLEKTGNRIEDFDAAIAAHARASGATLVSANREHMARIPELALEDWLSEG